MDITNKNRVQGEAGKILDDIYVQLEKSLNGRLFKAYVILATVSCIDDCEYSQKRDNSFAEFEQTFNFNFKIALASEKTSCRIMGRDGREHCFNADNLSEFPYIKILIDEYPNVSFAFEKHHSVDNIEETGFIESNSGIYYSQTSYILNVRFCTNQLLVSEGESNIQPLFRKPAMNLRLEMPRH